MKTLKSFIKNIEKDVMWLGSKSAGGLLEATRHFNQSEQTDTLCARNVPTLSHCLPPRPSLCMK